MKYMQSTLYSQNGANIMFKNLRQVSKVEEERARLSIRVYSATLIYGYSTFLLLCSRLVLETFKQPVCVLLNECPTLAV